MKDAPGKLRAMAGIHPAINDAARALLNAAADENERLRHMLSACVVAHETGRYEPQRIAYEVALNWLRDNPSE